MYIRLQEGTGRFAAVRGNSLIYNMYEVQLKML
jgi:hypothetical protein